jgi:hypothetical protein
VKVVLMAYKIFDIKLSPNKSTIFPDSFKILGVMVTPGSWEQEEELLGHGMVVEVDSGN